MIQQVQGTLLSSQIPVKISKGNYQIRLQKNNVQLCDKEKSTSLLQYYFSKNTMFRADHINVSKSILGSVYKRAHS